MLCLIAKVIMSMVALGAVLEALEDDRDDLDREIENLLKEYS